MFHFARSFYRKTVLILLLSCPAWAMAQGEEKMQTAMEVLQLTQFDRLMDQCIDQLTDLVDEGEEREFFLQFFAAHFKGDGFKERIAQLYCEIFTLEQLQDLKEFYKTAEGETALLKVPYAMQRVLQMTQEYFDELIEKLEEEFPEGR